MDFSKAFDTVDRDTLWKLLSRYGCPQIFIRVLRSFHDGMTASICCGDGCSDPFSVRHGVKQGCVLAPTLFTIFLAAVLKSMREELGDLYIRTRSDGDLFNLRRLKAKNKTQELLIQELLFADHSALVTHSLQAMQDLLTAFAEASKRFGLTSFYLMGDMNYNMASMSDTNSHLLSDITDLYGLHQLINEPTRVTDTTSTLIDLIYTNYPDKVVCSGVCHVSISDHSLIFAYRKLSIGVASKRHNTIKYRSFKNFSRDYFRSDIASQN